MEFKIRSEATRKFIIKSAAEIFNKKGLAGTSIIDLEKATGLTTGSIYGNFRNKEDVALAAFDYNLNVKMEAIHRQADQAKSFKAKILAHINIHLPSEQAQYTPGGCPMLNTAIEADDTHDELRKRAAEGLTSWSAEIEDLIKKGVVSGEFRAEIDSLGLSLQIISLIEGAALFGKSTQDFRYAKKLLNSATQLVDSISN